jgi:tetratricopeptide (TPR) repeat protein
MMAERSGLDHIIGGAEAEAPEADAAPAGLDPAAAAVAMEAARSDAGLAGKAASYFDKQARLVDIQTEHLHEQRAVSLSHLKLRRFSDQLKVGLQLFVIVVATAIGIVVARMAWGAAHDNGLVIEAFSVPPDFVQRGLTGRVLASRLQDKLSALESQTESTRPQRSYANDWAGDIKVEIPETGISIGELSRLLHEELGHASHIQGEVFHAPQGLTVSVRPRGEQGVEANGAEADLDALIAKTAEGVFANTQPYRYAVWLARYDRGAESIVIEEKLANGDDPEEQFWGRYGMGARAVTPRERESYARQAVQLRPYMNNALNNLAWSERVLGHDEAVLSAARRLPAVRSQSLRAGMLLGWVDENEAWARLLIADELNDTAPARRAALELGATPMSSTDREIGGLIASLESLRAHEGGPSSGHETPEARLVLLDQGFGVTPSIQYAIEQGRWADAAAGLEEMRRITSPPRLLGTSALVDPRLAEAYAHLGRWADADALLRSVPTDVYEGWRVRGRLAALRRNWALAETDFQEAVRQSPSVPGAYQDWGDMLATKGDLAGAVSRFRQANGRSPHWADPLKAWGDILQREGLPKEALAKYVAALRYAPDWLALRQARAAAAKLN